MIKKLYLPIIPLILIALALIVDKLNTFTGFFTIITSSSIKIDYLQVSFGGTLLNVSLLIIFCLVLLKITNLKVTGPIFAGIMSVAGCGFYGANIINIIPIQIGIILYAALTKAKYKNNIIPILFSVGISPAVSFIAFGTDLKLYFSIPIALFVGIVIGLIIPAISGHVIIFHGGYNLFNVGFSLGIIAMVFNGFLSSFKISKEYAISSSYEYNYYLLGILALITIAYLITGLIISKNELDKYKGLLKRTGRLLTDYIRDYGIGITMLNISLISLICIALLLVFQIKLNGVLFGSILMILGFSALGIHPKNSYVLILSSILTALLIYFTVDYKINPAIIFLVMGLSPIKGRYGIKWGLIVGVLHTLIVPACSTFQGGFDLFNNGFAAGFIAGIIVPVIDNFRRDN